jgi:hypothetical protein
MIGKTVAAVPTHLMNRLVTRGCRAAVPRVIRAAAPSVVTRHSVASGPNDPIGPNKKVALAPPSSAK